MVVFDASDPTRVLWFDDLAGEADDEFDEATVRIDSGKLYIASGALLQVRDQLTGRSLGQVLVPGLDEFVDWSVSDGAFLIAEETRATVYEVPD